MRHTNLSLCLYVILTHLSFDIYSYPIITDNDIFKNPEIIKTKVQRCVAPDCHPLANYEQDVFYNANNNIDLKSSAKIKEEQFKIKVNNTIFEQSGQWFNIEWSGIKDPSKSDWIALYVPPDDLSKAPVKYIKASESPDYLTTGSGKIDIYLVNHRDDMRIYFLRGFPSILNVIGKTEIIKNINPNEPLYPHLALTPKESEISVQWVSGSMEGIPTVKYGHKSGIYDYVMTGKSTTYTRDEMCNEPANSVGWIDPGYFHEVIVDELENGKMYYYVFGDDIYGYSDEHIMKVPGKSGPETSVKILGLADMGQANIDHFFNPENYLPSILTSKNLNNEENVDIIIHIGDISYAQGFAADWDVFFDQWQPIISQVPYMVSIGNHERLAPDSGDRYNINNDSGGECGIAYEHRLKMPGVSRDKPWYSYDFGPIHFLTISGEHDFFPNSIQYEFIVDDLSKVDRKKTPWVIVTIHRPMYLGVTKDTFGGKWYVSQELQEALEDTFTKYKVDMIWSGHHHSYQRSCPVYKKQCVGYDENGAANAMVHVVFGNAGATIYTNLVPVDFIKATSLQFGYIRAFANATHIEIESIRNTDLEIIDSFILYKPYDF